LVDNYLLRVAYFVNTHDIPPDLVYNSDHTPVHFIQLKGKAWQVAHARVNDVATSSSGATRERPRPGTEGRGGHRR
jgi:hypothetical protein